MWVKSCDTSHLPDWLFQLASWFWCPSMLLQTQGLLFCWKVLHCVSVLYFLYPCITWWTLWKFQFCAIVNNAAVNMEIHIFDILISFGYISHGGTLPDNMRISIFNSLFWHYCFVIWGLCKCEHMLQLKIRKTMGLVCITSYYSWHVLQTFSLQFVDGGTKISHEFHNKNTPPPN